MLTCNVLFRLSIFMTIINEPCEKVLLIMLRKYTVVLLTQLYDMSVCSYTVTNVTTVQIF